MRIIKRYKALWGAVPVFILFGLLGAFLSRPIARAAGGYLVTSEPLERADAIVVLAAFAPDRILEAADLYEQGYAPFLILSTEERPSLTAYRRMETLGISVAESHDLMMSIARQQGVPEDAILIVDSRANSTRNEAQALMPVLLERHIRSIIAVTSKSHSTRTGKIFRQAARGQVRVIVHPSRYDDFDPDAWWQTRWQARTVLYEYLKLLDYIWITVTGAEA